MTVPERAALFLRCRRPAPVPSVSAKAVIADMLAAVPDIDLAPLATPAQEAAVRRTLQALQHGFVEQWSARALSELSAESARLAIKSAMGLT